VSGARWRWRDTTEHHAGAKELAIGHDRRLIGIALPLDLQDWHFPNDVARFLGDGLVGTVRHAPHHPNSESTYALPRT
jgi:hypothetical protein